MSYNPNFYNNFGGNNSTFQHMPPYFVPPLGQSPQHYVPPPQHFVPAPAQPHPHFSPQHQHCVPPPPQPPPFFIPSVTPAAKREKADQDFLSTYENRVPVRKDAQINVKCPTLTDGCQEIRKLFFAVMDLTAKKDHLTENMSALTEEEWSSHMKQVEEYKAQIGKIVSLITGPYLEMLQKLQTKRLAKRLRLKRLCLEKKREKEERIKELKEKSRKIDENLQKIKDDINKAKQEAEEKLQADVVLKEVLRKKSDAKKCLTKLDAVQKLRKARQNTATGRGESVSDVEAAAFNTHIDKLRSLWARKLILYEMEEGVLRDQLKADSQLSSLQAEMEQNIASNLAKWRETLFGGQLPQVDFGGDVAKFIGVRSKKRKVYDTDFGQPSSSAESMLRDLSSPINTSPDIFELVPVVSNCNSNLRFEKAPVIDVDSDTLNNPICAENPTGAIYSIEPENDQSYAVITGRARILFHGNVLPDKKYSMSSKSIQVIVYPCSKFIQILSAILP